MPVRPYGAYTMRCIAPSGLEHVAQRAQPGVRIGKMVQHAGADDLVERRSQLADALDRQLVDLEIVELVFALERLGVATLVALKSMPVTRAAGQRNACLAACDVPQPATRMEWSSR